MFITLFLIVTFGILYGTLSPSNKISKINFWDHDKIWHFLGFMIWTFLYGIVWSTWVKRKPNLLLVFIFGSFYGLLIEVLQFILPTNRSPELMDFVADVLGSGAAILLLIAVFAQIFPKKNQPA